MNRCRYLYPIALSGSVFLSTPEVTLAQQTVPPIVNSRGNTSPAIYPNQNAQPTSTDKVSQLIITVKTDKDEDKRVDAAHDLRDHDPAKNPEMIPILIDVLQNDSKAGVRAEAAATLSKFRPISQDVGMALERATKDSSFRVRWQARSSLMSYRLAGYRGAPKVDESAAVSQDGSYSPSKSRGLFSALGWRSNNNAPMAESNQAYPPQEQATSKPWTQWFSFGKRTSTPPVTTSVPLPGETAPPPLAQPDVRYSIPPASTRPKLVPTEAPLLQRPGSPSDAGPDLPTDR
jgi:hypothetical protein